MAHTRKFVSNVLVDSYRAVREHFCEVLGDGDSVFQFVWWVWSLFWSPGVFAGGEGLPPIHL